MTGILECITATPAARRPLCLSLVVHAWRVWMAMLRLLHTGLENVHRFCPEEQKLIGTKAVATAELFFNAIITART